MKDSKLFRNLAFVGTVLCAACCLLPIPVVLLGMGALTFFSAFLKWTGILAMDLGIIFVGIYFSKRGNRQPVILIAHLKKKVMESCLTRGKCRSRWWINIQHANIIGFQLTQVTTLVDYKSL